MKISILTYPDGSVYMTLPHSDSDSIIGNIEEQKRVGELIQTENGIQVNFLVDSLKCYNKSGFASMQSAVAYEQEVLSEQNDFSVFLL